MPVVVIPTCFLDLANLSHNNAECRVLSRTEPSIVQELFQQYPSLFLRFKDASGRPHTNWFALIREQSGDYLSDSPDSMLGEDERIELVNLIGC